MMVIPDPPRVPSAGSDVAFDPSEPQFLAVGRVVRPHGVHGEVCAEVHTAYPERFKVYKTLYLGPFYAPYRLKGHRFHQDLVLLTLEGVNDRDQAAALRDQWVWISVDEAIPLEEGEFYLYQALGFRVVTDAGEDLGRVTEIMETGANDVLVVRGAREVLLPLIPGVLVKADIQAGQITVHLPDGLLE